MNYLMESWHHRLDFYQTITSKTDALGEITLPPGVYQLSVLGIDCDGGNAASSFLYLADMDIDENRERHNRDFAANRGYYRGHPLAIDSVALVRAETLGATGRTNFYSTEDIYFICPDMDEYFCDYLPEADKTLAYYFLQMRRPFV